MNTKILITTLIVSFSMLLFSQHTFAGQKEHFLLTQKAAKKLDLTLDQQDKIAAIIKDKKSAMGAIKKDKKMYKMELNELMQKEYFDDQQVKKAIDNIQSVNAKKMFKKLKTKHQIMQVLTERQKSKLAKMKKRAKRHIKES